MTSRLAEIRTASGADGARAAIVAAITAHGHTAAAAASLGVTLGTLRRAATRLGVPWPERPRGRPRRAGG